MPGVEMRTEKAKLTRTLRRFDMALFGACAIIGFDSLAYCASAGLGQAVTWLAITVVIFLIPFGLLTAEVTAAFPAEGGLYPRVAWPLSKLQWRTGDHDVLGLECRLVGRHADRRDDRHHRRLLRS